MVAMGSATPVAPTGSATPMVARGAATATAESTFNARRPEPAPRSSRVRAARTRQAMSLFSSSMQTRQPAGDPSVTQGAPVDPTESMALSDGPASCSCFGVFRESLRPAAPLIPFGEPANHPARVMSLVCTSLARAWTTCDRFSPVRRRRAQRALTPAAAHLRLSMRKRGGQSAVQHLSSRSCHPRTRRRNDRT
jgi:hypothetical protein